MYGNIDKIMPTKNVCPPYLVVLRDPEVISSVTSKALMSGYTKRIEYALYRIMVLTKVISVCLRTENEHFVELG